MRDPVLRLRTRVLDGFGQIGGGFQVVHCQATAMLPSERTWLLEASMGWWVEPNGCPDNLGQDASSVSSCMASSAALYDCNTNTEATGAVNACVRTARGVREALGEG